MGPDPESSKAFRSDDSSQAIAVTIRFSKSHSPITEHAFGQEQVGFPSNIDLQ
jgi:hypothetical protein